LSFLAVADSKIISLKMNNSTNTTFIAKPFYWVSILNGKKGTMQKNWTKISSNSPLKLCENAKMKAKLSAI
jgi:hypothetical protein